MGGSDVREPSRLEESAGSPPAPDGNISWCVSLFSFFFFHSSLFSCNCSFLEGDGSSVVVVAVVETGLLI